MIIRRAACPACRAEQSQRLFECPYGDEPIRSVVGDVLDRLPEITDERYELRECDRCRLVWQVVTLDGEEAERLYAHPSHVETAELAHDFLGLYASAAREVAMLVAALGGRPRGLRFLDYGMGRAEWARMAGAFGVRSHGVDIVPEARDHARRFGVVALAPDEIEGRFDVVHTEQVFEHLPDPLGTLERLAGLLSDRGLLKISVPDASDLDRRLRRGAWDAPKGSGDSLNVVAPLEHLNAFRRSTLVAMGRAAGLAEARIPWRAQYAAADDVRPGRPLLRALARPLYRNVLRRGTYVFFRRPGQGRT